MTTHNKKSAVTQMVKENMRTSLGLGLLICALIASNIYLYRLYIQNEKKISEMLEQSQLLTEQLSDINQKYSDALARVDLSEKEKVSLMEAVQRIGMDYNATVQNYNQKIVEVDTLQKTVSIDDELLSKYSKYYFLNENYAPATTSLTYVDKSYTIGGKDIQLLSKVKDKLELMIRDASSNGVELIVHSGYRSFREQQGLKGTYVQTYGLSKSNSFSADQGYSEHQLGSTVDISDKVSGLSLAFDKTKAYGWLNSNAHRYGFILSYPKGNIYYQYEPWHWRYVGVELATYMYNNNKKFYDLEQSFINTYKVKIFE